MTIKLENLVSELNLDTSKFNSGSKLALAATGALVAGIGTLVAAAGTAIKATFEWASDVDKLGDVMGGTNKQMAAMAFIAKKSGVGVDTLAKANTIMEKSLVNVYGGLDKVGISLYRYGINVKDANGVVKDQATLTEEISKKYQELGTQQERINFLTEVYGKSGGELVDFFDTLAQDGGIDAVTKKVEAFGLAIDPSRYEQFTRSLEELKLMGTGLAVQFTEKVMPALESALNWFSTVAPKVKDKINKGDWSGAWDVIVKELGTLDTKIAAKIDNLPWASWGVALGDHVEKWMTDAFQSGQNTFLPKFVVSFTNGIDEAIRAAGQGSSTPVAWGEYWKRFFDNAKQAGDPPLRAFFIDWETSWTTGIREWGTEAYNAVVSWINKITTTVNGTSFNIPNVGDLNNSHGGGGVGTRRASSGYVIAGQNYNVAEFKPEMFTPNQSGRIDQINPQSIDENKIGDAVGRRILRDLPPLLQMLKA